MRSGISKESRPRKKQIGRRENRVRFAPENAMKNGYFGREKGLTEAMPESKIPVGKGISKERGVILP